MVQHAFVSWHWPCTRPRALSCLASTLEYDLAVYKMHYSDKYRPSPDSYHVSTAWPISCCPDAPTTYQPPSPRACARGLGGLARPPPWKMAGSYLEEQERNALRAMLSMLMSTTMKTIGAEEDWRKAGVEGGDFKRYTTCDDDQNIHTSNSSIQ